MLSKKAVVVLVIIALILASSAVVLKMVDGGKKISTSYSGKVEDSSNGKIGVEILPTEVEDKRNQG